MTGASSDKPWELHVDGSANRGGQGAGIHLTAPNKDKQSYAVKFSFPTTGNEAEYEALLLGLDLALTNGARHVKAYSDSLLITSQISGAYDTEEPSLKVYLTKVRELVPKFASLQIDHIPREQNMTADALSKLASGTPGQPKTKVHLQTIDQSRIFDPNPIFVLDTNPSWQDPIRAYLVDGELPEDKNARRRLLSKATKYYMRGTDLYRRGFAFPDLRCVTPAEASYVLEEVHQGACGIHQGARTLAHKVIRSGYFWPTIVKDAENYVRRCDSCQRHASVPRLPAHELVPISSPLPFAQWGIDILGPFKPSTLQKKHIIVAVDYFTKWVEAEAVPKITEQACTRFVWQNIVCRFGVPRAVVSDNGRQFDSEGFASFCEEYGIHHKHASVAYPQCNGLVEAMNKVILGAIKQKVTEIESDGTKKWAEVLPEILWADRTTAKVSTGHTPYELVYGSECVLPVEIGATTLRVRQYDEARNSEGLEVSLDLLEELRDDAWKKNLARKEKIVKYFNKKVRARSFPVGSLVLRLRAASGRNTNPGKLASSWEGPYVVHEAKGNGAYKLKTMEGEHFPHTWNAQNLRRFYQ